MENDEEGGVNNYVPAIDPAVALAGDPVVDPVVAPNENSTQEAGNSKYTKEKQLPSNNR